MSGPAVAMMILSILLLWGGLVVAIIHLNQSDSTIEPPPGRDL